MNRTIPKQPRVAGTYVLDGSSLPTDRLLTITGNLDATQQGDSAFSLSVTFQGSLDGGTSWADLSIYHWTGGMIRQDKTDPLSPLIPAPCGFEITIPAIYRNAQVAAVVVLPQDMILGAKVTTS